ncbi:MAG TPA: cation:proton antiporter [Candidatus Limnocylindria bacterium]|nr:cation:proton antiporter [Candidatus Limnocylindria bacterium]
MTGSLAITLLAALGSALVLGALAHRIGLAPMIGYIAAGLVVGPFTPGVVADPDEVLALADIGVALLMFSIGLQFRLAELREVGRLVLIGAPVQVAITMAVGTLIALWLGSSLPAALFLGAVVSICSSVVLVKIAGEGALASSPHGRIAFSWSIVQDLLTVVLVVLLTAVADPEQSSIVESGLAVLLALVFVGAVLVIGSRLLPVVLGRVAHLGSRELFVVAVAVIAIGTAALAHEVGVSVALGAFIAGLALAESDLAASVLGEIVPLRELFATVFFVSVGILLQPVAVLAGWPLVLALLLIIVLGKGAAVAGIVKISGRPYATALLSGGLVAQAGEFSFVLATVGLEIGALDREIFSNAMGAVVLSMLLAAPVARGASILGSRLERRFPAAPPTVRGSETRELRRHVVLVGYGVVGRTVARVLEARSIPWVAVDADYPMVRRALEAGKPLLYGDAATREVLDAAYVDTASTMVIAISNPLVTRQAASYAMSRNERLHVVARAHSVQEEAELRRLGVARVITVERQVGFELVRHTLGRYGVSEREVDLILRQRS